MQIRPNFLCWLITTLCVRHSLSLCLCFSVSLSLSLALSLPPPPLSLTHSLSLFLSFCSTSALFQFVAKFISSVFKIRVSPLPAWLRVEVLEARPSLAWKALATAALSRWQRWWAPRMTLCGVWRSGNHPSPCPGHPLLWKRKKRWGLSSLCGSKFWSLWFEFFF